MRYVEENKKVFVSVNYLLKMEPEFHDTLLLEVNKKDLDEVAKSVTEGYNMWIRQGDLDEDPDAENFDLDEAIEIALLKNDIEFEKYKPNSINIFLDEM